MSYNISGKALQESQALTKENPSGTFIKEDASSL